ncbi:MAG: carboxypeptidase regulatory-like domain-containing protein [Propionibacteriaceae bacterium]|nr:carboxypeptidase regulatory-like domain-containing protein [Propionibacteriaceae bacterium]
MAQLNQADQPAADATGSVTGVVTGPDGQPLEDVGVDILVDADGALDPIGTTSTDKFGAYTFTDVAAGTYSLLFWADGFASVYWGGAPVEKAAETFAVTTDAVTHNVQLAAAATIAGTLKTVDDDPIKDASVHLSWHDPQSGTDYPLDSAAKSNSDGQWKITNLVAGTYTAEFIADGYLSEWYDDQTDQAHATPITAEAGNTEKADASLASDEQPAATGSVSGTVRGGGSGLAHVLVTLYRAEGDADAPTFHKVDSTRSDVDGSYSFTEVANGTYSLFFDDSSGYLDRWLGGFADSAKAVTFRVTGSAVEADDISLPLGATVSGLVKGDGGPLADASVTLYTSCGHGCTNWKASTSTGSDGHYTFTGLEDDVYSLYVTAIGYVSQWFGGSFYQASAQTFATATASTVLPDVQLQHGGSISGTVNGDSGALTSVEVDLYGYLSDGQYFTQVAWTYTDSSGEYSFPNLPDGVFTLRVHGSGDYVTQWLGSAPSSATATRLTIANKSAITQDVQLTIGGSVSGTVTQDGTPISGYLYLYTWNSGAADYVTSTWTDGSSYSFTGLPSGDYTLELHRSGTWTWLGGATNSNDAQKFTIVAPAPTVQNFALTTAGGTVSGMVTAGDVAQPNVYLRLDKFSNGYADSVTSVYTDSEGHFFFTGLADGEYTLYFSGSGDYGQQYLGGTWNYAIATRFTIASASSVTQNFALVRGQTVAGTVTGDNGPLANVNVQLYSSGAYLWSTSTGSDGTYSIRGVVPGTYTVQFSNAGVYQNAWLGGATNSDDADTFTVPADDPIVADIQLVRGGTVSGTISGADGGLGNVQIQLSGNSYYKTVYTNYDGTYRFQGLADGTYSLWISGTGGYISTTTSTFMIQGANSVVRDVRLTKGGTVSGTVTGGGAGLASVPVYLHQWWAGGGTSYVSNVQTNPDGTYSLTGLADGTYTLYFYGTGNYVSDWLGGVADSADAQTFTISGGNTVVENEAMTLGGTVAGNVTGGGLGLANSYVTLYDADGGLVRDTYTSTTGTYTITGVRAGTYTLHFGGAGDYVGKWLGDGSSSATATTFTVTAGGTVTRDAQLALGGSVSGTISGGGTALAGAEVELYRLYVEDGYTETDWVASTESGASGGYRLAGLEPGTYSLVASADGYVRAWLGGASSADSATTFTITSSEAMTGRDLDLTKAATISGTVTGAHGEGVADVYVKFYRYVSGSNADYADGYDYQTSTSTASDGHYSIGNLPPGTYKVEFAAWNTDYVSEWWDGKYSEAAADTVTVASGQTKTANATLGTGVTVTGHATEVGGAALPDGTVVELQRWYPASNYWDEEDSTELAADGAYSFTRLTPGDTYRLVTRPFGRDYASDTFTRATEGTVTVDLSVPSGAWVSGRVLDENSAVVRNVELTAWDRAGRRAGLVSWNGDAFTVKGLFQGAYTLSASSSGVPNRFLGGADTIKTATFLTLTGTERLTGKDIVYATGATVIGRVTDATSSSPLRGVEVSLVTRNGTVVASTSTGADGTYSVGRVPKGIYALWFDGEGDHVSQWWGGEPGSDSTTGYFTLTTGTLTRDLALSSPGSVTGVLSGYGSYAEVMLYQRTADGDLDWVDEREIYSSDGPQASFSFGGLAPGDYYLRLNASILSHSYWWPSALTSDSAEAITVTAGGTANLGAFALAAPSGTGVVKGTISAQAGVNWSSASVELETTDGSTVASDESVAGGAYEITGVPAGTYFVRLHYNQSGYASDSWYPGLLTRNGATPVEVGDGATITANLTLSATTASLSGTVTGPNGEPVSGVYVELSASSPTDPFANDVAETETDAHGHYAFNSELVSGQAYSIRVYDDSEAEQYLTYYYGGVSYDTAGSFVAGTTTTLDVTMQVVGSVSGTVTDAVGSAVGGIRVHLIPAAGGYEETTTTDDDGTYTLDWLRPGTYTVRFGTYTAESDDCDDCVTSSTSGQGVLAPLWYDAASTPSTAKTVTVASGGKVTGINGSLGLAGELSGAVSGLVGGKTSWLHVAVVTLYTADGEQLAQTTAGANGAPGAYSFSVPAGSYKVCAAPPVGYTGSVSCAGSVSSRFRSLLVAMASDPIGQAGVLFVGAGQELEVNDIDLGAVAPTTITGPVPTITVGGQSVVAAGVGDTLTAVPGTWSPVSVTLSYTWRVGGVAVGSGATYVVAAADAGRTIRVTVTATGDGLGSQEQTSGSVTIGAAPTQVFTTTPKPAITGDPTVGSTLIAAAGTWVPAPDPPTYQWLRDGAAIKDATDSTYQLVAGDAGHAISVTVTGKKAGYQTASQTSSPTLTVLDFTAAPVPTITGTAQVGQTLTLHDGTWPAGGTLAHQWESGSDVVGTGDTYLIGAGDLTRKITVTTTWSKTGYPSVPRTSTETDKVANGKLAAGTVTITGDLTVGQTLTASKTGWPDGVSVSYQWKRADTNIATGSSYLVVAADKGKVLTVVATGVKAGYDTATAFVSTSAVAAGTLTTAKPSVSGDATVGKKLAVSAGTWGPGTVDLAYQWLRGTSEISGATAPEYVPTTADVGAKLSVRVTGTKDGYETASRTSDETAAVVAPVEPAKDFTAAPTPTISVTGKLKVGAKLTANTGSWQPDPSTLAVQWLLGGTVIPGATGTTYTVVAADAGLKLTVQVTASRAGYETQIKTSAATATVPYLGKTKAATPKISGTAKVGKTLKAKPGTWKPKGFSYSYQWFRSGAVITGATKASYKLTAADKGKKLTVKVTGKKAGYPTVTKASKATGKVK